MVPPEYFLTHSPGRPALDQKQSSVCPVIHPPARRTCVRVWGSARDSFSVMTSRWEETCGWSGSPRAIKRPRPCHYSAQTVWKQHFYSSSQLSLSQSCCSLTTERSFVWCHYWRCTYAFYVTTSCCSSYLMRNFLLLINQGCCNFPVAHGRNHHILWGGRVPPNVGKIPICPPQ